MELLKGIGEGLGLELFHIAGRPVTPLSILLTFLLILLLRGSSVWIGRLCHRRLLSRIEEGPRYTMVRLIQYGIWIAGIILMLQVWRIDLTALALGAGVLGIVIGFGVQNLTANFVAGIVMLFERPVRLNDFVTTQNVEGRIHEIGFRATKVVSNDNISIIVPNSELMSQAVTNWSHGDPRVRLVLCLGVAYGSDVQMVTRVLIEVARETEAVLGEPEPRVRFAGFGDSALEFELLVWTNEPIRHRGLRSRINYGIEAAFRENGIQIPFPQRDLHVRFAQHAQVPGEK